MSQTVSGNTALFALVAFALNAACYPSTYGTLSLMRTSPIFCLTDLIISITAIIAGLWNKLSIRQAFDAYFEVCLPEESTQEQGTDVTFMLRACVFLLSTLPQFLRIAGTSGLPWTVAWAAIYLIASIVSAVSLFARSRTARAPAIDAILPRNTTVEFVGSFRPIAYTVALFVHVLVTFTAESKTLELVMSWRNKSVWLRILYMCGPFIFSICLPGFISRRGFIGRRIPEGEDGTLLLLLIAIGVTSTPLWRAGYLLYSMALAVFCDTFFGVPPYKRGYYWNECLQRFFKKPDLESPFTCLWLEILIAVSSLGMALIAYMSWYDSRGTVQESWTKVFGL